MYLGEKQFGNCKIEKGLMLTNADFHKKLNQNSSISIISSIMKCSYSLQYYIYMYVYVCVR